jgi:hypothetical protein
VYRKQGKGVSCDAEKNGGTEIIGADCSQKEREHNADVDY